MFNEKYDSEKDRGVIHCLPNNGMVVKLKRMSKGKLNT